MRGAISQVLRNLSRARAGFKGSSKYDWGSRGFNFAGLPWKPHVKHHKKEVCDLRLGKQRFNSQSNITERRYVTYGFNPGDADKESLDRMAQINDFSRILGLVKKQGKLGDVELVEFIRGKIMEFSFELLDVNDHQLLLEIYSDCGMVSDALCVFEEMPLQTPEAWHEIIRCLVQNGLGKEALTMFRWYKEEGNKPDSSIFLDVLYACKLVANAKEGLSQYKSMHQDYGIYPTVQHYASLVELVEFCASLGHLDEALEVVESMPVDSVDVWETLMNLSWTHGDIELGDRCAEIIDGLDPTRLDKHSRKGFLPVKPSKTPKRFLSIYDGPPQYKAGDLFLPHNVELLELLTSLMKQMVEMGYQADISEVVHDVEQECKERTLLGHSERSAFAHFVLNSPPRAPVTVIKHIRSCVDCHTAFKMMGAIVGRKIFSRDRKRFHHFNNGVCSCKDYW
ncbi:PREDICTED: pentatricopeptide repeat-containing protein At2g25580-like [Camelina sativa]|uniref:Pentatricopeptide repeat-containing protein At2g25580-like n=1 Tax=Camelina sativa TaxID=90675 RepID=A0ABM1RLC7_CAMSA|nr:PREDICTED: pentatricopeptide repeat-containing protein At2g25580-like [Camelina sativa]